MEYQRNPDGSTNPSSSYPPIPEPHEGKFFTGWGYEVPETVDYWCWRSDYNTWGACVTFKDGNRMVTNPMLKPPYTRKTRELMRSVRVADNCITYFANKGWKFRRISKEEFEQLWHNADEISNLHTKGTETHWRHYSTVTYFEKSE